MDPLIFDHWQRMSPIGCFKLFFDFLQGMCTRMCSWALTCMNHTVLWPVTIQSASSLIMAKSTWLKNRKRQNTPMTWTYMQWICTIQIITHADTCRHAQHFICANTSKYMTSCWYVLKHADTCPALNAWRYTLNLWYMQAHADTCKAPETSQHMPIHAQLATYEDNNTALSNTRK